jgi:hypothetical protein
VIARTLNEYAEPATSPVTSQLVELVEQLNPPTVEVTLYEITGLQPLADPSASADHETVASSYPTIDVTPVTDEANV